MRFETSNSLKSLEVNAPPSSCTIKGVTKIVLIAYHGTLLIKYNYWVGIIVKPGLIGF